MNGLPAIHVNTTLLILIGALFAEARFHAASGTRTKIQERSVQLNVPHAL